jgi:protein involved in polysaccharide export with SLBB domain
MRSLPLVLGLLLLGVPAWAQPLTTAAPASVYRYAEPGRPTMDVSVWGAVRVPGRYQVEPDTDLLALLSYAGGPVLQTERAETEQRVNVVLSRNTDTGREVLLESTVPELVRRAEDLPALQEGDIVTVTTETKNRFQLRDAAVFTSTLATLSLVIIRLTSGR